MQPFILSENNSGLCNACQEMQTAEHVLIRCEKKYEQERTELIRDMQALCIMEFTLYNILKAGVEFNKIITALMKVLINSGLKNRI